MGLNLLGLSPRGPSLFKPTVPDAALGDDLFIAKPMVIRDKAKYAADH
jgi:hypothetical protein